MLSDSGARKTKEVCGRSMSTLVTRNREASRNSEQRIWFPCAIAPTLWFFTFTPLWISEIWSVPLCKRPLCYRDWFPFSTSKRPNLFCLTIIFSVFFNYIFKSLSLSPPKSPSIHSSIPKPPRWLSIHLDKIKMGLHSR